MVDTPGSVSTEDRPVAELVSDASEQVSRLVRDEIQLAVAELEAKGKRGGLGAGLFGAAGVVALYGGGALVACVVLALALVMPAWAAALAVAVAALATAAVLALAGRKQVKAATPVIPERAIDSVKADIDAVKEGMHR